MHVRVDVVPWLPVRDARWKCRTSTGEFRAGIVVRPEVPQAERDRLARELRTALEDHCREGVR